MTTRTRSVLWLLFVVLAFILGFLLGRRMCAR